jgi:putative spermidine/putrescine transport system permease protein
MQQAARRRPASFYFLATFFALFILFLYGPMLSIFILSFQGPQGNMTFPLHDASTRWFSDLFTSNRYGDLGGAFRRSMVMAVAALVVTAVVCFFAGLAFRRKFWGSGPIFYLSIISLVIPGLLLSFGIGQMFQLTGLKLHWMISGLGAHLSWTLPFGLLIMFAVLNRFDGAWEEAARDAGASPSQVLRYVTLPILFPGLIAVALFGFTLSYDEFPRSLLTLGTRNSLPLEVANMTSSVTTPALYAIGTITTIISLAVIALAFWGIAVVQRRRSKRAAAQSR